MNTLIIGGNALFQLEQTVTDANTIHNTKPDAVQWNLVQSYSVPSQTLCLVSRCVKMILVPGGQRSL